MDPSKRFITLVLTAGIVVLLAAIAIGERMGDRVLGQANSRTLGAMAVVTPAADAATTGPYGPDWKRSQTLAAASDPGFPDPRVPPKPLPTAPPTATPAPRTATPTPNPNVPIWDQKPFAKAPSSTPSETPSARPTVDGPDPNTIPSTNPQVAGASPNP